MPFWYKTLFYGLKRNHPLNASIVHPLLFLLRRILYSIVVTCIAGHRMLLSAYLMLFATFTMLLLATTALPWIESRINQQHIINEVAFYIMCTGLIAFAGAITDPVHANTLGWLLIALFTALVFYNLYMIMHDMV